LRDIYFVKSFLDRFLVKIDLEWAEYTRVYRLPF